MILLKGGGGLIGGSAPGGCGFPTCTEADTPPPPDQVHPLEPGTPPGLSTPLGLSTSPGLSTPLGLSTPPRTKCTPTKYTPGTKYTPPEHASRYGERAGGTHPTGMQSCFCIKYIGHLCMLQNIFYFLINPHCITHRLRQKLLKFLQDVVKRL